MKRSELEKYLDSKVTVYIKLYDGETLYGYLRKTGTDEVKVFKAKLLLYFK